ncbi:hypothetical protein D3C81_1948700 [compost metagenome]
MLFFRQPGALDQCQRQGDETGHQDRVQDENPHVQAQQVGMSQGRPQRLAGHARLTVLQMPRCAWHDEGH